MPAGSKQEIKKKDEKVSKIMAQWVMEIVSELENNKISAGSMNAAIKKSGDKIITQLKDAGLNNRETQSQVSQVKGRVINEIKKERRKSMVGAAGKKEENGKEENGKISGESEFEKDLKLKLAGALREFYGGKIHLDSKLKLLKTTKSQVITAEHEGVSRRVILKEINPETFCDFAVMKIQKYTGIRYYKINTFEISEQNKKRNYAVIEKPRGRSVMMLRLCPFKIQDFEAQYFRELGKIVALVFICAIPDRNAENITGDKTGGTLNLTTCDFSDAFNYSLHSPIACAGNTLDANVSLFGKTAAHHKEDLKKGFIGAFNSAKDNRYRLLYHIREFSNNTKNFSAFNNIKRIITQDPALISGRLIAKSKVLKDDFEFVSEIIKAAVDAIEGKVSGNYVRKFRPLDKRGKPGGLIQLPKKGMLYIVADIQANVDNFLKVFKDNPKLINELSKGKSHLVITGDLIHSPSIEQESTTQLDLLETAMLLKAKFPDNFHFLLGNHCLGEILGNEMLLYKKGKLSEQQYFEKLIKEKYKDNYKKVHEGYVDFLKHLPLVVRTENGIIVSHTGPIHCWNIKDMNAGIEKFINIFLGGYGRNNKELYQMLWSRFGDSYVEEGRGHDNEDIKRFLSAMNAKVMVVGHTPARGYAVHEQQMVVDSEGAESGYLVVDLTDDDINIEKLKQDFRWFKKGSAHKKLDDLNYEIMQR